MGDHKSKTQQIPPGRKRFVIRDELGLPVQAWAAKDRDHAIELFCHPALMWPPFEADGWTCKEEPT